MRQRGTITAEHKGKISLANEKYRTTWRMLRATLRDWYVLVREFWWPLTLFILSVAGVAVLFHLAYTHPNSPDGLAFDAALYAVLQMTLLGPELPIPEGSGHWLIIFYFMMPVIAIVLGGQGLANFLSLLFNRRERGAAWVHAVASTYSNHVVVCGLGHVGSRVIENLLKSGTEVIGVEKNLATQPLISRVTSLGVPVIEGDIRSVEILDLAGVKKAKAVVMCSNDDMANIEAAIHCRKVNPQIRLVVRMFDAELARTMKETLGIEEAFSASALAAPIFAGAALDVDVDHTFALGDEVMSVGRFVVNADSKLAVNTVGQLEDGFECSVIVHERGGLRDMHPQSNIRLQGGDTIAVLANLPTLNQLAKLNRPKR